MIDSCASWDSRDGVNAPQRLESEEVTYVYRSPDSSLSDSGTTNVQVPSSDVALGL